MTPSDYLSRMVDGRLEGLVAKDGRSPYRDRSRSGLVKVKDPSCYERGARRFGAALTALLIGTVVAACQAAPPPSTAIASTPPTWIAPTLQPTQPTNATPAPTATPLPSPQPIPLPTPLPGVSVAKKTIHYDIAGLTIPKLVDAMEQWAASHSPDGYWAGTRFEWDADWDYRLSGTCRVTAVSVSVRTFMTLPRWRIPAEAQGFVVTRWKGFIERLTLHEGGHVGIGIRTGNEIMVALKKVPRAATCSKLVSALRRAFERAKALGEARNTEYDRVTSHGRTQGAVFP